MTPRHLDHAAVRVLIDRRFDGDPFTAEESRQLREHLSACPDCRGVYDRTVAVQRVAAGLPENMPTALESRLLFEETLARLPSRQPTGMPALVRLLEGLLLPAAAAAAVLVLLLPARPVPDSAVRSGLEDTQVRGGGTRLPDAGLGVSGIGPDGGEYEAVASEGVCLGDALRFYVTARRTELSYYFLFGIQAGGPLWYFPSPDEEASLQLPADRRLPWMVPFEIELAHRHRPEPLLLVLLLSPTPLSHTEVSDWVTRGGIPSAPERLEEAARARFGSRVAAAWAAVTLLDCGGKP